MIESIIIDEHQTQMKISKANNSHAINERVTYYKSMLNEMEDQGFQITIKKRLSMLSQGAATIRVGGNSDMELQEN